MGLWEKETAVVARRTFAPHGRKQASVPAGHAGAAAQPQHAPRPTAGVTARAPKTPPKDLAYPPQKWFNNIIYTYIHFYRSFQSVESHK